MQNKDIIREANHVCKPSVAATEVKRCVFNAKKRAMEDDDYLPMSKIYKEGVESLYNQGLDLVTEITKCSSIKSSLNDCRNRAHGLQKDPATALEIMIPEEINTRFLFIDKNTSSGHRILVFATNKARDILANSKSTVFMDGTFKSCSKQFCQLYTIHIDIGSTAEETNTIPVLFALLPKKTKRRTILCYRQLERKYPPGNQQL